MDLITSGAIVGGIAAGTKAVKVVTKFLDSVDRMTGGEARRIVWAAEAEVKAAMIKEKGSEALEEYIATREQRKMSNTMQVIEQAKLYIEPDMEVSSEPISQDWLNRFQSTIEDISEPELQDLWAKILAGEIKAPNSYSLRTLDVLRNMTQKEAQLFSRCTRNYLLGDFICVEKMCGVQLREMQKLAEIGVLSIQETSKPFPSSCNIPITRQIMFKIKSTKTININANVLTTAGVEIMKLISPSDNSEFIKSLSECLKSKGAEEVVKYTIHNWDANGNYSFYKAGVSL